MKCPNCFKDDNRVLHTRMCKSYVRRRRICNVCGKKFTTKERVDLNSVKN